MEGVPSFDNMTLKTFLDRVAADVPTLPAGGCAAGLCAALAAALAVFVARLSRKKSRDTDAREQLTVMVETLRAIQEASLEAICRDADAYEKIMAAQKMAKGEERDKALQSACITALAPPMTLVEYGVKVLRLSLSMGDRIYPAARADGLVAAHLAYASLQSGLEIAGANIDCIVDKSLADSYRNTLESFQAEGESLYGSIRQR
jgi:formiminotetrahydrofolate cyclodeaminase